MSTLVLVGGSSTWAYSGLVPSFIVMLARGLALRCPRCGSGGLFGPRFTLHPLCPRCGLRLERESGAVLGSMALNIGATSLGFIVLFSLGLVATWPSVPWLTLTLGGVAFCAIFPVVFYPFSKTLWAATDLILHGSETTGLDAGRRVVVGGEVPAVVISADGSARSIVVPAGTALVVARDRQDDVPRVTCVPADPEALGLRPGDYLVVNAADIAA